jgi:uracil-DNA glycosylase family 4
MNPCPGCTDCALSKTRKMMLESKGSTPADVLFLIEGPSMSDEMIGKLMSGPEGRTLIKLCFDAAELAGMPKFSIHVVPMVFCRPTNRTTGENREPRSVEVLSCMRNVMRVVTAVNPKLTVLVGKVVTDYYKDELPESISVLPPWVLVKQPARYNTNMRNLAEGLKKYVKGK